VQDQTLTVAGERPVPAFGTGMRVRYRERPAGRFARAFRLPKPVDADGVTATYRDGILSITVPLRDAATRRKIEVQG
jgi:HSP20 family protein